MSKMDNLRAMREARYEKAVARAGQASRPRPVPVARPSEDSVPAAAEGVPGEELCAHRNMSGRTCTREKGHAAKSHRYS